MGQERARHAFSSLEFINKLRPVDYRQDLRGNYIDYDENGGSDVLLIGYGGFIAPLIKSDQELYAEIKELKNIVEELVLENIKMHYRVKQIEESK